MLPADCTGSSSGAAEVDGDEEVLGWRRTTATLPSQKPTCVATLDMFAVLLQLNYNNIQGLTHSAQSV